MRLTNGLFEDRDWQTVDLHIHLESSNTILGTSNFEVHITGKIFCIHKVSEDMWSFTIEHQTHSHTRDRALDWHTSIHES